MNAPLGEAPRALDHLLPLHLGLPGGGRLQDAAGDLGEGVAVHADALRRVPHLQRRVQVSEADLEVG